MPEKLIEELRSDDDIFEIRIVNYCRPWYVTRETHIREKIADAPYNPLFEWKHDIDDGFSCLRPKGTPEEVKDIETIWTSEGACEEAC